MNDLLVFSAKSLGIFLCFATSIVSATYLIRYAVPLLKDVKSDITQESKLMGIDMLGFWIGFFETVLIFMFVMLNQYPALALLIGAKQIVRKDKIEENPSYFLLGMFINISIALLFATLARICFL